jgi:CARDB protein
MLGKTSTNANWRVITAILAATTLVFSAVPAMTYSAFADSGAQLKALPKKSLVDDGNNQLLELKFKLEEGTLFNFVRITIDENGATPKVLEFDAEGNFINAADPAFQFVFGQITMLSDDGYALGKSTGKFEIVMDKLGLGEGEHTANAEVVLNGGDDTLTAEDSFLLKPSVPILPDLVAKHFFAPTTVKAPLKYMAFTIETNEGHANAKEHKVNLYLSNDNSLSAGDKQLDQSNVAKLRAGWFDLVPSTFKVPKNTENGAHYLIVKADATDKVQEISEDNNVLSKATNITPY